MENVDFRPPYVIEYNKLNAFFAKDPTISFSSIDEDTHSCEIYVDDTKKASVLSRALYLKNLNVKVIDTSDQSVITAEDMGYLLKDCPLFSEVYTTTGQPIYSAVMLHPAIVKVNTDNAFSPSGCDAYTSQQLARELFHGNHINFQTEF